MRQAHIHTLTREFFGIDPENFLYKHLFHSLFYVYWVNDRYDMLLQIKTMAKYLLSCELKWIFRPLLLPLKLRVHIKFDIF